MSRRNPVSGKTVLVTGGGSGIGRLLALGAADRGARVVIWDLSAEAGESVAREVRTRGGQAEAHAVDVSDPDGVRRSAAEAGPVDVLINNAGVVTGKYLLDATEEAIERTFKVNTLALFWTTRAFLPHMIAQGSGTVVTVSSAAAYVGVAKQIDYSSSKFAAFGFAESLRAEMQKLDTGVISLAVCPYYIDTGMFDGVQTKFPRLLPILKPEYATNRILDAIEKSRSRLNMPWMVNTVAPSRVLPVRAFDALMNFFGVNSTMDHFTGRTSTSERAEGTPTKTVS